MLQLSVTIVKVQVLLTDATDVVKLYTNLPSPFTPEFSNECLVFSFQATHDTGISYVRENLKLEPVVVNTRTLE